MKQFLKAANGRDTVLLMSGRSRLYWQRPAVVNVCWKDIDFEYGRIHVCQAKGKKDRFVPLPMQLVDGLMAQIDLLASLHRQHLAAGHGEVLLPEALAKKYPNAARKLQWQYLFPSGRLSVDQRTGTGRPL